MYRKSSEGLHVCLDYTKGTCMVELPVVDVRIILKSQKLSNNAVLETYIIFLYIYKTHDLDYRN